MQIAVFSRGPTLYSTRRLVEAARGRGYGITVVDHALCSPFLGEGGHSLLYRGKPLSRPDVVVPRIGANITARGVGILRQLDVMRVPHTLQPEALLLARDKMGCLQKLAGEGVAVPRTVLCFSAFEARQAAEQLGPYPVVVKLLESTHGVGVALADSDLSLLRLAESFLRLQDRILIQEYIAESNGADIRAFVVGGKIVAAMERQAASGEFRANLHRGAAARALELREEEQALVLKIAAISGVEVAGIDLISSRRGPLLMEVNASPGLEGIEGASGVDVAGKIIEYAVQKVCRK